MTKFHPILEMIYDSTHDQLYYALLLN